MGTGVSGSRTGAAGEGCVSGGKGSGSGFAGSGRKGSFGLVGGKAGSPGCGAGSKGCGGSELTLRIIMSTPFERGKEMITEEVTRALARSPWLRAIFAPRQLWEPASVKPSRLAESHRRPGWPVAGRQPRSGSCDR
jgi:hypothetical protein